MLGILEKAINQAGVSPDNAFKLVLAYVVRTEKDAEISRRQTISAITEDGVYYKDVVILRGSRFSKELPHTPENSKRWGSRILIGFIDNSVNKPIMLGYVPDTATPSEELSMNTHGYSNGSINFVYDGIGHTSVSFNSGTDQVELLLYGKDSKLTEVIEGTLEAYYNSHDYQATELTAFIQTVTSNIEDYSQTCQRKNEHVVEKKTQTIESLEQKIKELQSEIDTLKLSSSKVTLQVDNYSLVSKDIKLSSEKPGDYAVLFTKLNTIMSKLLSALQSLTVTCTSPGSPSSPPINMSVFAEISSELSTMKSKYIKID